MRLPSVLRFSVSRPRLPWNRPGTEAGDGGPTILGAATPGLDAEDVRIIRRTRLRLMAVSGGVTLVLLAGLGVVTYVSAGQLLANNGRDLMQRAANAAIDAVQHDPQPVRHLLVFGQDTSTIVLLVPPSGPGTVLSGPDVDTQAGLLPDQASLAAARTGQTDTRDTTLRNGRVTLPVRIMSVPALPNGTVIQVVQDRTSEVTFLSTLLAILVGVSFLALLLSLLAGYLYAGRALVPIRASMTRREAALKRQREFAANASHELRTPLTVIGASVEDLKRNRRSRVEDVGEALEDIDAEVRHMTALVEDLLLLARTDSGVVQVDKVPVDLADVAVEAVSTLSSVAEEKGVGLELDPLPAVVLGDQLRLRQLVTILTDNAIKHTRPRTTVRVHVHPDPGLATLRVDDEGPGVRPEDLPRLFERFWRADDAPVGGTGLGLSIAKWIVEQHQGTIGAFNRQEGGATFWAQIPLWTPQPAEPASDSAPGPLDPDPMAWAAPAALDSSGAEPASGQAAEPDQAGEPASGQAAEPDQAGDRA